VLVDSPAVRAFVVLDGDADAFMLTVGRGQVAVEGESDLHWDVFRAFELFDLCHTVELFGEVGGDLSFDQAAVHHLLWIQGVDDDGERAAGDDEADSRHHDSPDGALASLGWKALALKLADSPQPDDAEHCRDYSGDAQQGEEY